ncbi:DUF3089 domain-containing protein [Erythrobacter sp. LQ02-29]|uniref:DUF3089 domain-containing protein n=1 Tax=unclassified Erythrobacter TaxID=2633097 RepID=UPI001BFC46F0|nr:MULTISPECIES: DUF3089 domain-containing protein [unclassified Erythrobacter]MCP9223769.1 DUF3089 domain-containing protein [Erythrobacter sp. LQ02-29]QWC57564.1 DUF3089 domain-containing protein [Erythrobacter sp. 3-20A1M]
MVRKFLYAVAIVIALVIAAGIALVIWSRQATEYAFVPRGAFTEQAALAENAYEDPSMWYSRPGIGISDPSRYQPAVAQAEPETGETPSPDNPAAERTLRQPDLESRAAQTATDAGEPADPAATPDFAVFFIHPTSYIPVNLRDEVNWNASLGDQEAENRARLFLQGMASAFNRADEIWAPKYRQAAVGAFLTDKPEATKAIDAAYRDVAQAFDYFVASVDPDKPIVLAGHSQGALLTLYLLQRKVKGTPLEKRIAAVYAIGWPISVEHDLPALGLPACATAGQAHCIVSYESFADDGDPQMLMERYEATPGFDGQARGDGPVLCVNPITGTINGEAPASANLGTLVPSADLRSASLLRGSVPARCDASGLLRIGSPPEMGSAVLPGDNYHVYDIPLFWRNLQEDVVRRVAAWANNRPA